MAFDDDYRELIENARDAMRALFEESEHDAWPELRAGYGELRTALEADERLGELQAACRELEERRDDLLTRQRTAAEKREQEERKWQELFERRRDWLKKPRDSRENDVLQVLGDNRLTVREIAERISEMLPVGEELKPLYDENVRPTVMRMLGSGQLDRVAETFRKTRTRYRYFRKRGLEGPIADLERLYQEGGER